MFNNTMEVCAPIIQLLITALPVLSKKIHCLPGNIKTTSQNRPKNITQNKINIDD
jgi:hypothetical protein